MGRGRRRLRDYVDETGAAGIVHRYDGGSDFFVGGGVAAFDCNDDGRDDLYFAGGSQPAALYRNESPVGGALRFVANRRPSPTSRRSPARIRSTSTATATRIWPSSAEAATSYSAASGTAGSNDANDRFGIDGGHAWTVGFSATWEGTNALPTLAFANYLVPGTYDCDTSELVRPAPTAGRYAPPIALRPGLLRAVRAVQRLGPVGRTRPPLGQRPELLPRRDPSSCGGSPRVKHPASTPRRTVGGHCRSGGWASPARTSPETAVPEVFITSQGDNKLQTLVGRDAQPTYADIALERGVTAQRPYAGGDVLPSTAWHPEFADVNNDGFVDLFVTKGNVEAQVDYAHRDPNNLLLGRRDGTFVEGAQAAGIVGFERGRGAALVDLNLDGMLDLVVVNRRENVKVWRNVGRGDAEQPRPEGHWIGATTSSNRARTGTPSVRG